MILSWQRWSAAIIERPFDPCTEELVALGLLVGPVLWSRLFAGRGSHHGHRPMRDLFRAKVPANSLLAVSFRVSFYYFQYLCADFGWFAQHSNCALNNSLRCYKCNVELMPHLPVCVVADSVRAILKFWLMWLKEPTTNQSRFECWSITKACRIIDHGGEASLYSIYYVFYTVAFRLAAGELPLVASSLPRRHQWCGPVDMHCFTSAQKNSRQLDVFLC